MTRGCVPECHLLCPPESCTAPNTCQDTNSEEYTTTKADLDYYDEDELENSTTDEGILANRLTTQLPLDPTETTIFIESEAEGTTWASANDSSESSQSESIADPGADKEESQSNDVQPTSRWILWVSISSVGVVAICFVIYLQVTKAKSGREEEPAISYTK